MWPAIEQLIQNGSGNRYLDVLNAIGVLHQRCTAIAGDALDAEFDAVIAQFATELDSATAQSLCPHAEANRFPQFNAALVENAGHRSKDIAPASQAPDIAGDAVAKVDRRALARDPIADQNNPITLARRASQDELLQIAALPNLPEALSNVLISRGNREVLERVLRNPSAVIARSSLTTLAELAPSDRLIKNALSERFDMPEAIVDRVLPFLPKMQKARLLLCGLPFDETHCSQSLRDADEEANMAASSGQPLVTMTTCFQMLDQDQGKISEIVALMAKETRIAELAAVAAYRLDISPTAAFNALSGRLDHAAVIILRALDCDMAAVDQAMQMRRRLGCREARETRSAQLMAQRYSLTAARELAKAFDDVAGQLLSAGSISVLTDDGQPASDNEHSLAA
jgi:hypothetical protein